MGLLDTFTGGKSDEAADALKRAEGYFTSIKTPSIRQMTLPELQQYVEAGIMTPAEAQAYLQDNNAYNDMNVSQTGTGAQISALNQLSDVANAGAEGTPMQQAQMENAIQQMNTSVAGQRGAIEQSMAAKGIPASLISAALQNQTVGQEAQQAHMDAVNAQGMTYQNALNALSQEGAVGNSLQGQQNTQANTVANAANAMQQFNAANQQQNSQFNAGNLQEANRMNAGNRQQISNNNVGLKNARTQYNAGLPQQDFSNQMARAGGAAGAAQNYGKLIDSQGQQNAGITAGLINLGTSFIPKAGSGTPMQTSTFTPRNPTEAAFNDQYQKGYAHGGVVDENGRPCYDEGGMIPGDANFPGDTPMNDQVPISVSPGEAVIPRSSVQQNPEAVSSLIEGDSELIDPMDVATLLKAMRAIRMGAM